VTEAVDAGQFQGSGVCQQAEQAAGFDRTELGVITNQHQLRLRPGGQLGEAGQVAARDHACLIDHEHLSPL
jgi:hypothetical protein